MSEAKKTGLDLLRVPFPAHHISKLPKPTKAQTDEVRNDYKKGERCTVCGGWHHPKVVHLDYVGHAALTDRLLDADHGWSWEPLSIGSDGLPVIDESGGLWIRLTVCGVTRLGYGDAQGKTGGDAMKERIGDALRNAAMRFGAALDLWHKGDLHLDEESPSAPVSTAKPTAGVWDSLDEENRAYLQELANEIIGYINVLDIKQAVGILEAANLDAEDKIGIWTRFDSKQRSAIKAYQDNQKAKG